MAPLADAEDIAAEADDAEDVDDAKDGEAVADAKDVEILKFSNLRISSFKSMNIYSFIPQFTNSAFFFAKLIFLHMKAERAK